MTDMEITTDQPIVVDGRKISVSYSRKVSDGNYGGWEAHAWVQGDAPESASPGDIAVLLGDLFVSAKAAVLDELGIPYKYEEGYIREDGPLVDPAQAVARVIGAQPQPAGGDDGGSGGIRVMNPKDQQGPLPDWLINEASRAGVDAVFDNRKTATGRQPLFKEAIARGGTGHGKDGEPKAFWPPKD